MESSKDLFGNLFENARKDTTPEPSTGSVPAERQGQDFEAERFLGAAYKKGDFIGQKYEVAGVLGMGGFGVVYLVYSHETKDVYALKTFRDEYLENIAIRERFHKEALVWVDLDRHPYLVRAHWVDEVSGRLYIAMEYIAPNEQGLNSLDGYLERRPPDLAQSLRWAVQFCYGMEHAYSKGIRSHRDIKPANIMISQDKTVKISDFGLAGVVGASKAISGVRLSFHQHTVGLSYQTIEGAGFGTPTHMPPEQFSNAAGCDERSDIYSFGIVLYQMATGGQLPFLTPLPEDNSEEEMMHFWWAMHKLHSESSIPKLDFSLFPIIQHCLEKEPSKRFQTFRELRADLEPLLERETGEFIKPPTSKKLEAWEWDNKGVSLHNLGHDDEAIHCFNEALEIAPQDVAVWTNKGNSFYSLGRVEEAICCYDKALEIHPRFATAWNNKGYSLAKLSRLDEAIGCYDKALEIDPRFALAWGNKGNTFGNLGRYDEALRCFDRALEIDSQDIKVWYNKGICLHKLGNYDEAILCFDRALELDPRNAEVWHNKGGCLGNLGRYDDALRCFNMALEIDPRDSDAWYSKGVCFTDMGHCEEAIHCYDKTLEIDPQYAKAWYNKGNCLDDMGCYEEAIRGYDKVLEIDPRDTKALYNKAICLYHLGRVDETICCYDKTLEIDPQNAKVWYNKGVCLDDIDRFNEAIRCYEKALEIDPQYTDAWSNKGISLTDLGCNDEAIRCFDKALELDPRNAAAWYNKALAEDKLGRSQDVAYSFEQFIALAPTDQYAEKIEYARERLEELKGS